MSFLPPLSLSRFFPHSPSLTSLRCPAPFLPSPPPSSRCRPRLAMCRPIRGNRIPPADSPRFLIASLRVVVPIPIQIGAAGGDGGSHQRREATDLTSRAPSCTQVSISAGVAVLLTQLQPPPRSALVEAPGEGRRRVERPPRALRIRISSTISRDYLPAGNNSGASMDGGAPRAPTSSSATPDPDEHCIPRTGVLHLLMVATKLTSLTSSAGDSSSFPVPHLDDAGNLRNST